MHTRTILKFFEGRKELNRDLIPAGEYTLAQGHPIKYISPDGVEEIYAILRVTQDLSYHTQPNEIVTTLKVFLWRIK